MVIITLENRKGWSFLFCSEAGWGTGSSKAEGGTGFGFGTEQHFWPRRAVEPITLTSDSDHVLTPGRRDQRSSPNTWLAAHN